MKRFERGLVVGKFSPLHLGHEFMINCASRECAEVALISYSQPELPGCDTALRESWLKTRFSSARILVLDNARLAHRLGPNHLWSQLPSNDAPAEAHRAFCAFVCDEFLGFRPDAVYSSEDYGPGFAESLTKHFRQNGAQSFTVYSVIVDQARTAFPISATELRGNPAKLKQWLAPEVYASFVKRVCFLGGESSGKSSLAAAMAERCSTEFVAEYGRELWEKKRGALVLEDFVHIASTQAEREDEAAKTADGFLFCDTSPLTTLFYSQEMFGRADEELKTLADRTYDLTVLCSPDFPFVQDGTRRDASFRARQHEWYLQQLNARGTPFLLACGPLSSRIEQVCEFLRNLP